LFSASIGAGDSTDQYSDWSPAINLGSPVNRPGVQEINPVLSRDGLSLYFHCVNPCPGGFGGTDIMVAQRPSVDAPWGPPINLGPGVNTPFNEGGPNLSQDGHFLYFQSNRPGGFGGTDLYVARRTDQRDDFAWQPAVNLGPAVNSAFNENTASDNEDDETGVLTLYFASNRPGGQGGDDIYASTLQPDGTFGLAAPVVELNSPSNDRQPAVRRDALELFLASDRPGSLGELDLWVSTRSSNSDPWASPVNLGPLVNSTLDDAGPGLSFDGTTLYFQSVRPDGSGPCTEPDGPCAFDLWVTTRTKLRSGH
jgi:Tol biopolymer transport system component